MVETETTDGEKPRTIEVDVEARCLNVRRDPLESIPSKYEPDSESSESSEQEKSSEDSFGARDGEA